MIVKVISNPRALDSVVAHLLLIIQVWSTGLRAGRHLKEEIVTLLADLDVPTTGEQLSPVAAGKTLGLCLHVENFVSHSGLAEQTRWSKWDVKPGQVGLAGAGDNSDIGQHGVRR